MPLPPLKGRAQGFKPDDRVGQDRAQQILELRNKLAEVLAGKRVVDRDGEATRDDILVDFQQLSAARSLQLYLAQAGDRLVIGNSDGTCDATNTITVKPYPGCLINSATTLVINAANDVKELFAVNSVVAGRVDWMAK